MDEGIGFGKVFCRSVFELNLRSEKIRLKVGEEGVEWVKV